MTSPQEQFIPLPDGQVFTLQWGEGPLLLFLHATGMCARVYTELLAPLGAHYRVIACDARGHGRTTLPLLERLDDWKPYRADLIALVESLGQRPAVLAGHSFGATTVFEAAVQHPGLADHVVLIDPALIPFRLAAAFRQQRDAGKDPPNIMAAMAARRRARFDSRAKARAAYLGRGVFEGWPEQALDAYLDGGLQPDGEGVKLACTPAFEMRSYLGVSTTLAESMAQATVPFTLLAAGTKSTFLAEDEASVREMHPQALVKRFPGTRHFLPVTHPDLVRPFLQP